MTDTPNNTPKNTPDGNPTGGDHSGGAELTAFALGELEPGSDVYNEVQARLDTDADARAYVEQTRALGEQLAASYRDSDAASSGLSDHQQKELATMIDQHDNEAPAPAPMTPPKSFWLSRPALIAAGLALAAGAAITAVSLMGPADTTPDITNSNSADTITGLAKVGESLAEPVAVDFDNAPLAEVLAFLNKQTQVAFDTDWDALAKRGIDAKTPVSLKADELIPAGRVLSAALEAAWSQSQHPDPAQWTMTDAGVTVAPQSALVEARLAATAALLKTNRLSTAPLDERVLTPDRAEVWESDLWNKVLAQRDEAGAAVLAEADAAFDAADEAIAADELDRAARKTMYAYQLITANNTLLKADMFDQPAERFEALSKTITEGQRKEREAAMAKALQEAKKRYAEFSTEENAARLAQAEALYKQAEQLTRYGDLNAATQRYEDAVLLDPENGEYAEKYKQSTTQYFSSLQPLAGAATRGKKNSDRKLYELQESIGVAEAKLESNSAHFAPAAPLSLSKPQPSVTNTVVFGLGGNANSKDGQAGNARFSHSAERQSHWYGKAGPVITGRNLPGAQSPNGFISDLAPSEPQREMTDAKVKRSLSGIRADADFERDGVDYYDGPYDAPVQPRLDKDGKPISRRAALQTQLDELVKDKPLPQLDEKTKQQYEAITIALEEARQIEPLELKRLDEVQELEALRAQFDQGCRHMFDVDPELSRDAFAMVNDNPFYNPADPGRAMSTFSVDVDTAAYTIARRQLMQRNQLPVPGAVRIEEMINYFDYNYKAPVVDAGALEDGVVTQASLEAFEKNEEGFAPFATHLQLTDSPWTAGNQLVRIGVKGMEVSQEDRPSAHLTFLLDVSGSMNRPTKLGLVKDSLKLLLDKLNDKDHVSIVVYAGASGIVLENAPATNKAQIEAALDKLRAGGSTAGAAGIQLAYETAQKHYIDGGVNRVILCTDGDFNVGISGTDALVDLIKSKANPQADDDGKRRGVYLSVMAYGMGNLNDAMMEPLTNAGNGNYAYIDTLKEATKVMYDQAGASLVTIAKDVKIQVHFDASQVMAYRLIGYENRVLANVDFDNDKVDAGDIGAGHSVTALYEIVPFPEDGDLGNEGFFEVNHRIEKLEEAVVLNQTLMQTASLSPKQSMKLAASTRMLEQEVMLAGALAEKLSNKPAINDEDAAPAEAQVDVEKPATADDIAHEAASKETFDDGAMMAVKLRYKPVDAPAEDGTSRLIASRVFADEAVPFAAADDSTRFAASVASFAMQLRSSPHAGDVDLDWVHDVAKSASNHDPSQLKAEMLELVKKAKGLMPEKVIEKAPIDEVELR
jgi:secreted protein with Ig-like and vWFA domain